MTVGSDSICPKKCIYRIRIFCHFLVAKSDQKASLAKAKTYCNRLFENSLHEINSRNQRSNSISKTA